MAVFTIDGEQFNVGVKSIQREFAILDGENAGRVKSGDMDRDIIGTYYNYIMELTQKDFDMGAYNALYEILSAPVNSRNLIVPYGSGVLTFKAYISNGTDLLRKSTPSINLWDDLKIKFTAMGPKRRP